MSEIKAGVVLVTKFVTASSAKYSNYINYIDREAAVRNEHYDEFNAFSQKMTSGNFEDYHDYMSNPEKTTGLFTAHNDVLNKEKCLDLKDAFKLAQENGSVMWQTVLSFDNRWLEKNGLYDKDHQILDEDKIREIARSAMGTLMQKENIANTAVWCASIHYNTDNLHIHIATVEPVPTRPMMEYNGKMQRRGKFKQSSIDATKSKVVNQILNQQQENILVNNLLRKSILGRKKERNLTQDTDFKKMLDNLYIALPESSKKWYYNTKEMEPLRPQIDAITKYYLEKYHKEDMEYIQSYFEKRSESYTEAYGNRKNSPNQYAENKMDDLYTRMGNEILKDFRNFEQEKKEEYFRHLKSSTADKNTKQRHSKKRSFSAYRKNSGTGNGKLAAALQKTMNDAMKQHMKNLQAYELQQQASEELEL